MTIPMMRLAAAALVAAMLCGCATTVPTTADLKPTPQERITASRTKEPDSATLTILRDKGFVGSAIDWRVLIDGMPAAQIAWGEFAVLYVKPGERIIEVRHPSPTIGMVGDSTTLRAEPGAAYFYRINADVGVVKLLRTTSDAIGVAAK